MARKTATFDWNDYRADVAIGRCSLAARGLWMHLLCIAATAEPVGYVVVGGKPLAPKDIAAEVQSTSADIRKLVAELERNGVCSRDKGGRIFCRRMVRAAEKTKRFTEYGHKGGSPKLLNGAAYAIDSPFIPGFIEGTFSVVNRDKLPDETSHRGRGNPAKKHIPEVIPTHKREGGADIYIVSTDSSLSRSKKEDSLKEQVTVRTLFNEFYFHFPRKVGKRNAERAFLNSINRHNDPFKVIDGAKRYAAERTGEDPYFTKHPATWLNQDCQDDEPMPPRGPKGGSQLVDLSKV